jgi:hypothetical protein
MTHFYQSVRAIVMLSCAIAAIASPTTAQQPMSPAATNIFGKLNKTDWEREELDQFTKKCQEKLDTLPTTILSFGCHGRGKVGTAASATAYFGNFKVGDVVAFSLGDQSTLYAELIQDNLFMSAFLGYARVGLGALVGADDDSTATTVQQLFESGGNATAYLQLPIYRWINFVRDQKGAAPIRHADLGFAFALRSDVPQLNAAVEDPAFNTFTGLTLQALQHTSESRFRFFLNVDSGWIWSPQDEFYENLGISKPKAGLLMIKSTAGFDLNQLIRIGASVGTSSQKSVKLPVRLSVQLLPQGQNGN